MSITKLPLTEDDKKLLKRVLKIRIIIGSFFIVPLIVGLSLLLYLSLNDFKSKTYDFMTFFGMIIIFSTGYLFFRFVIPFYKNSFKNVRVKNKLIIETYVLAIKEKYTTNGLRYIIETDTITINSWEVALLSNKLPFYEIKVNMKIKIHQLENNSIDILYLEKTY